MAKIRLYLACIVFLPLILLLWMLHPMDEESA